MEGSNWTKNIESMGVLPLERDAPGAKRIQRKLDVHVCVLG
jgi:hypothetical protein